MKIVEAILGVITILVCLALISLSPSGAGADLEESIEQERVLCIEECRRTYWPQGTDAWRSYYKCIDDCENNFWKQWNDNMKQLDKK